MTANSFGTWAKNHRPGVDTGWRVDSEAKEIFRGVDYPTEAIEVFMDPDNPDAAYTMPTLSFLNITDVIEFQDGTAALPSITSADRTRGLHFATANEIGFSVAGVHQGEIDALGINLVLGNTFRVGEVDIGFDSSAALALTNTLIVGIDDTGHDVKFFGATSGTYMLWDDSADTLAVVDGGGLVVGHTALLSAGADAKLQVLGTGIGDSRLAVGRWSADANGAGIDIIKSRNATIGSSTVVQNGDAIGDISFYANDGTDHASISALIRASIDATPGSNDTPGRLILATTSDGAASPTERVRITAAGHTQPGSDNVYTSGRSSVRWSEIYAAIGTMNTSDRTLKTDIVDSPLGLDFILAQRPVEYTWIEGRGEIRDLEGNLQEAAIPGTRPHYGLISQEVKQVMDAMGIDFAGYVDPSISGEEGPLGLRYGEFTAPIIKAIQQMHDKLVAAGIA